MACNRCVNNPIATCSCKTKQLKTFKQKVKVKNNKLANGETL